MKQIVLAGHSAGAQMAQRYAVVGRPLQLSGVHSFHPQCHLTRLTFNNLSLGILLRWKPELVCMAQLLPTISHYNLHDIQPVVRWTC
jgi:dienelactone hydrolase